jgi:3-hydroxyacyl-CoA dehydrogenase
MSNRLSLTPHGDVAVITVENPPVNALSDGVPEELAAAVDAACADAAVRAIVVIGAGTTFIAGADINELERAAWDERASLPDMHDVLRRIELASKPVVMAIHGNALGGGLEVAMAGHYRVAVADARVGQPEVNLGIIPGAEGTQRLPRLVGVERAIDMCVTGRPLAAPDAAQAGLIDRVVEGNLLDGAIAFARDVAARPHPRTRDRWAGLDSPASATAAIAAGRELAARIRRGQIAPLVAVDAIAAATTLPFDEGCRRERELFVTRCLPSEQCKALVHAFLAERGVSRVPDLPADARPRPVDTVAIVGAGTMGAGIAMACANAGLQVRLVEASPERLGAGLATVRRNYESSLKRGRLTPAAREDRLGRIAGSVGYDAIGGADLVIEAVFEDMALKKQVFGEIDRRAHAGAVLATNTSTLDLDALAAVIGRPSAVVGLHFFSPAHVMRLVEIVRGQRTSAETLATALAVTKRLGKVGVVVGNGPGFVGNRLLFPYMYEAQFLVEDGATPEQVDRVLTDWGMAMGIFAVDDLGGLDVAWRCRRELNQFSNPGDRRPLVSDALVEMGRLGQKTGRGWSRYEPGDRTPRQDPDVLAVIERTAARAGITRRPIADDEILQRCLYALVNAGARVLEEGLAARAADIDVIYLTGYGFPGYRGGPMFWADRVGLPVIFEAVSRFHRDLGPRWAPAPLLERLAREGGTFRGLDQEARRQRRGAV